MAGSGWVSPAKVSSSSKSLFTPLPNASLLRLCIRDERQERRENTGVDVVCKRNHGFLRGFVVLDGDAARVRWMRDARVPGRSSIQRASERASGQTTLRERIGGRGTNGDGSEIGRRLDGSGKGGDKCLHDKCVSCVRLKYEMLGRVNLATSRLGKGDVIERGRREASRATLFSSLPFPSLPRSLSLSSLRNSTKSPSFAVWDIKSRIDNIV